MFISWSNGRDGYDGLDTGGPYTHDDPNKTGAARTAARPLLVQKKPF